MMTAVIWYYVSIFLGLSHVGYIHLVGYQ